MKKKIRWFVKESLVEIRCFLPCGWGNGYVVIPKDHPMCKKDYTDIPVEVHGWLTFGVKANKLDWPEITEEERVNGSWVYGFDTTHYGDSISKWPKKKVEKETKLLAKQFEDFYNYEKNSTK